MTLCRLAEGGVTVVIVVALLMSCSQDPVFHSDDPVESIVFVYGSLRESNQEETITEPNEVSKILKQLRYEKKQPCKCEHLHQIVFQRASGSSVRASICNHCFDVLDGASRKYFKMPKGLYAIFEAYQVARNSNQSAT